jgi:hypothetical protein
MPATQGDGRNERGELGVEVVDLGLQRLPAAGQSPQCRLDAEPGSVTGPGRRAAQARIRSLDVSFRSGARTGSGAVTISASS